ncbi:MAG: hypothetical protein Q8K75_01155 [Chlamydiales bacterium]|nr:hypothetical protein [Chlamydiales bacterium]
MLFPQIVGGEDTPHTTVVYHVRQLKTNSSKSGTNTTIVVNA